MLEEALKDLETIQEGVVRKEGGMGQDLFFYLVIVCWTTGAFMYFFEPLDG